MDLIQVKVSNNVNEWSKVAQVALFYVLVDNENIIAKQVLINELTNILITDVKNIDIAIDEIISKARIVNDNIYDENFGFDIIANVNVEKFLIIQSLTKYNNFTGLADIIDETINIKESYYTKISNFFSGLSNIYKRFSYIFESSDDSTVSVDYQGLEDIAFINNIANDDITKYEYILKNCSIFDALSKLMINKTENDALKRKYNK